MNQENTELGGPDLTQGVEISTVPDGTMLLGHIRDEAVLLIRRGDEMFAIGATCTHYGAPLVDGLLVEIQSAVPGIMPASACAPARLFAPRRSTRFPAGASSSAGAWLM